MNPPVVTLLTDYGLDDEFVGVCHGVIARICPQARVIDVSHGVPRHDARTGALMLAQALPYLPAGVHVAIVDPDVGGRRRAIAVTTADSRILIGPDNGVLWPGAQAAGGIVTAVEISHSPLRLEPVAATFHGRDIFCPVAAHLAAGTPLDDAGPPLDPDQLVRLEAPCADARDGRLRAEVTLVDRFGNLQLGAGHADLETVGLRLGSAVALHGPEAGRHVARYVRTFADAQPGELIVYEDAGRRLAVAVSHGSAAQRLRATAGALLTLTPSDA